MRVVRVIKCRKHNFEQSCLLALCSKAGEFCAVPMAPDPLCGDATSTKQQHRGRCATMLQSTTSSESVENESEDAVWRPVRVRACPSPPAADPSARSAQGRTPSWPRQWLHARAVLMLPRRTRNIRSRAAAPAPYPRATAHYMSLGNPAGTSAASGSRS